MPTCKREGAIVEVLKEVGMQGFRIQLVYPFCTGVKDGATGSFGYSAPWKSLFFEEQDFIGPHLACAGMFQGNSVFCDGWPPDSLCLIGLFPSPYQSSNQDLLISSPASLPRIITSLLHLAIVVNVNLKTLGTFQTCF